MSEGAQVHPNWYTHPILLPMIQTRTLLGIGAASVIILLLCLTSAVFAFGITRKQWEGPATRAFARITTFPAGKVAGEKAAYVDYLSQIDAQRVYLKTEDARMRQLPSDLTNETREAALNQILQIAALNALAKESQVSITDLEIDRAFDEFVAQSGTSTSPGEIDGFLQESFGWSRDDFKRFFIRPGVLSQALRASMPGTTEEEKGEALGQKLDERLLKEDVKKYLIIRP